MVTAIGTVTVSSPFFEMSSTNVATRADRRVIVKDKYHESSLKMSIHRNPERNEVHNIAKLPSKVFFPSEIFQGMICFPNRMPIMAAAASPMPHIRIAVMAIYL